MKKSKSLIIQMMVWIIIGIIVYFISVIFHRKRTKDEVAKHYKISKPTLAKWVRYFQNEIDPNTWNKKRYITFLEFIRLKKIFGEDIRFVLCKRQIFEQSESDYKTVAANVKKNLNALGITLEAWESCSVYPPSVSKKILDMLS